MCGRYTLISNQEKIKERFTIDNAFDFPDFRYNVAPTENVLAVINNDSKKHAGYLKWGLIPAWSKDKKSSFKMINARSETAHELPSFRNLMARKRCLIIADSFYEWRKDSADKRPERIQTGDRDLFAFAGLFDTWRNGEEVIHSCTILTKDSDEFMQKIHPRMPIILPRNLEDKWISESFKDEFEAHEFIQNLANEKLNSYTVSNHVNYAKNKGVNCIEACKQ